MLQVDQQWVIVGMWAGSATGTCGAAARLVGEVESTRDRCARSRGFFGTPRDCSITILLKWNAGIKDAVTAACAPVAASAGREMRSMPTDEKRWGHVRVPPEPYRKLRVIAHRERRTMRAVLERMIDLYPNEEKKESAET